MVTWLVLVAIYLVSVALMYASFRIGPKYNRYMLEDTSTLFVLFVILCPWINTLVGVFLFPAVLKWRREELYGDDKQIAKWLLNLLGHQRR